MVEEEVVEEGKQEEEQEEGEEVEDEGSCQRMFSLELFLLHSPSAQEM